MSGSAPRVPRHAASVILVRPGAGSLEVFLVKRHRQASFMSGAYVFPGGVADPGEDDVRVTAARELFEEAGLLLTDRPVPHETRERWRTALQDGADGAAFGVMLAEAGAALAVDALHYFAHWITPTLEGGRRRYSAQFFVAALPEGAEPAIDNREVVDAVWATPDDALARAATLRLPPPQVRTLFDLREAARAGLDAVLALVADRAAHRFPILPRMIRGDDGMLLLLPWDPEYERAAAHAAGDDGMRPMSPDHLLAVGPSRFVLEGSEWKNVYAPGSPREE